DLLTRLSDPHSGVLDVAQACVYARHWVALDPLDEAAQRRLMRVLANAGQRTAALLQFEHCRRLLETELGIAPEPETIALYEALKLPTPTAAVAPFRPPRLSLPLTPTRLIGRDDDMAALAAALADSTVRLLTITGPGGVGKTRLALQVAAELAPQFAVGAAFISLASLTDPNLVVPTVARALGLSEAGNDRLLEYLRPREVLLVLDNTEQLLATIAPLAAQALEVAPRLKLLVTSREPLRVRDEQLVPVHPLALPDPAQVSDLAHLSETPAVALFVERAREANPAFALTPDNAATIVELCQRLDGLPLAIELAAARLSLLTPTALLVRLEHHLPLLSRGARDLPQRQQTLHNTIAWSYNLLEAGEQQLFRRLAVFVGGFTLEAVQTICVFDAGGTSSSPQADDTVALEQVAQLLDKSLVQGHQGTGGEPRFTLLETIREYALEQLEASEEVATVQERHAHYFLRLAEEAEPHLYGPERDSWLERLEREDANLRAALAWSKATQDAVETGLRLAGALSWYWFLHDAVREGRTWLEEMLARTGSTDRSVARGRALLGGGVLAWAEDDFEAASLGAEEALSIVREAGDKQMTAHAEAVLGLVRMSQGNTAAARSLFEESHILSKDLGDIWGEAMTLYYLGTATYRLGDPAAARAHYEE
ncbi:MAG TPA: BTAD domain-containing putative transcriptional regulator, partial [Myxococcota bacterium]|nr:BTAD domain-containing putative transcriptional regulator [Myxococcota bacterium]